MTQPKETRREFLNDGARFSASLFLLLACTPTVKIKTPEVKEKEMIPQDGDIVIESNSPYLLRSSKKYPLPKGVAVFNRNTRASEFGARTFTISKGSIDRIAEGVVKPNPSLDQIGDLKSNRSIEGGGQKIIYFSGFMQDYGDLYQDVLFNDVFTDTQNSLKELLWGEDDRLFFTYGAEGLKGYDVTATMRDVWENVRLASLLIARFKEQFPLERFNLIAHSLGGFIAFFAAEDHLDAINNVVLLNSPVLGLRPDLIRIIAAEGLSRAFGDKVVKQLLSFWDDENHRRHVYELVSKMRKYGNRLYTFGTEGDSIVPPESSILEGSMDEIEGEKIVKKLMPINTKNHPLHIHRRLLSKEEAPLQMDYVKKIMGRNLAHP